MIKHFEQCEDYADQIAQLQSQIQFFTDDKNDFSGFTDGNGWVAIGDTDNPFKMKVINRDLGIFTKSYSPVVRDYADKVYDALKLLGQLQLSKPILPPLAYCERTLIFQAGVVERKVTYDRVYHDEEQRIVKEAIKKFGLEPLSWLDKVDVVTVGGVEYVVDPLSDDSNTIFEYIFRRKE